MPFAQPQPPRLMTVAFLLGAAAFLAAPSVTRADQIDDEYYERFKSLKDGDIDGQMRLAGWCRDQQRWQLVARQCRHVLRQQPAHEQAKILLELARAHLDQENKTSDPAGSTSGGAPPGELTDEQVQRIRRAELDLDGNDRVRLRIDRDALNAFYEEGNRDGILAMERSTFFRMSRLAQAQLILRYAPEKYGDKIEITTDPERMRVFLREVLPIVLRGCATAECHGGASAGDFRLLNHRTLSDNAAYANYYILNEYRAGSEFLINRDLPDRSLLLSYGLPRGRGVADHPTDISRIFADESDRDYRRVLDWISSLPIARRDYGFKRPDLVPQAGDSSDSGGGAP